MKRLKFALHQSVCKRCAKPITTSNRPLFGFMEQVADLKGICEECLTQPERDRIERVTRAQDGRSFR